jgi:redox-sensitive bicupin YhaK (pirin superfamily)
MTWIVSGALTHRDSMGSEETIGPGQVQYMSAGRGVRHSEFNGSDTETVHLLQIWILPREKGAEPRYADADFRESLKSGEPVLIISPDGAHGSSPIHADAKVYAARTDSGWKRTQDLTFGGGWLQLVKGKLTLNGIELNPGDGAAIEGESSVSIEAQEKSEFLLFDLA